jgi:hypothetical protein
MADVLETLKKLPRYCAAKDPVTGSTILIERGVSGYWPAPDVIVDSYNGARGVTPAQVEAMTAGSMFGWDCPAADPDTYAKDA